MIGSSEEGQSFKGVELAFIALNPSFPNAQLHRPRRVEHLRQVHRSRRPELDANTGEGEDCQMFL